MIYQRVLGWIAASGFRAEMALFPSLLVWGPAGSGKTTLVGEALKLFGFSDKPYTLTNSTAYGLAQAAAGASGIPLWIDEVRAGMGSFNKGGSKRKALEQLVRDAWDGGFQIRGGVGADPSAVVRTPVLAPVILSGEDAWEERSLLERCINVQIGRGRLGEKKRGFPSGGFGELWFRFVMDLSRGGAFGSRGAHLEDMVLRLPEASASDNRKTFGLSVVRWGWDLVTEFCSLMGVPVPWRWVEGGELTEEADFGSGAGSVIGFADLVELGLTEIDRGSGQLMVTEVDGGELWIRLRQLLKRGEELGLGLPYGERALRQILSGIGINWSNDKKPGVGRVLVLEVGLDELRARLERA